MLRKSSILLTLSIHAASGLVISRSLSGLQRPGRTTFWRFPSLSLVSKSSWSVADNWDSLSSQNPSNSVPDSRDIYNEDLIRRAALELEDVSSVEPLSNEDKWLKDTLDTIQKTDSDSDNTASEKLHMETFIDEMGHEIAMLVRCNESPEEMLIREGRALPPLTEDERTDVSQLVILTEQVEWESTPFFRQSISKIFREHATEDVPSGGTIKVMKSKQVAAWMRKSLGPEESRALGPHDSRVTSTISRYGSYGTGYLTEDDFHNLYLAAVIGEGGKADSLLRLMYREKEIQAVWRDLGNHGIKSPAEAERDRLLEELQSEQQTEIHDHSSLETFMDECEIVEEGVPMSWMAETNSFMTESASGKSRKAKSSHELVELASDGETPIWIGDGEFVFIDEQSCIGCAQCVSASPASFKIQYDGRARTFRQRSSPDVSAAVAVCPVNCMHHVSFQELRELEKARDGGDGRKDHRHFGYSSDRGHIAHVPLHVSGMDSDANHRDSWYHYLRNKCYMSNQCPQRGCFDCPHYSSPGMNPNFQKRLKSSNHIRAEHFIDKGIANEFRKFADI